MARSPRLPPIDQESGRKAEHDLRMGWMGYLTISNRPRKEKKFLLANPSITEEVIINY
ncbi:MAG: hypothetical protein QNJ74_14005 [Trichodesmium sp. MO_231.B1]|nr:hypothetical protein [Trichodesmium sp. MO_231.B1]